MSYIAAVLAFGLMWAWKFAPRKIAGNRFAKFVPFALLAIGTSTLATGTVIGDWAAQLITWVTNGIISLIESAAGVELAVSAATLAAVAVVVIGIAAILDLFDLNPEGIAKTAVIVLPFLSLVAVGSVAAAGAGVFESISQAGTGALTNLVR